MLADGDGAEDSVDIVHGQVEHFLMALLLLADVQHPIGNDLPHVGPDLCLNGLEIVSRGRGQAVLSVQDVLKDAGVEEDWVLGGPQLRWQDVHRLLAGQVVLHGKE